MSWKAQNKEVAAMRAQYGNNPVNSLSLRILCRADDSNLDAFFIYLI